MNPGVEPDDDLGTADNEMVPDDCPNLYGRRSQTPTYESENWAARRGWYTTEEVFAALGLDLD
jgi:hypothetical protein